MILTDEMCPIPPGQKMRYSEPINFEWPPYLLDFHGTPGERHVENLKVRLVQHNGSDMNVINRFYERRD